jgi:hypothetical protein
MITIQYEITIARRGALTTTVRERSFKSQAALERWLDNSERDVTVLRYLSEQTQKQEG